MSDLEQLDRLVLAGVGRLDQHRALNGEGQEGRQLEVGRHRFEPGIARRARWGNDRGRRSKAPKRRPGGTSVGGFQPSSSGRCQSRNRRSASSRTSPTTPLIRPIPSVQSLISLSQVCLYCCWVVALVC